MVNSCFMAELKCEQAIQLHLCAKEPSRSERAPLTSWYMSET